MSLRGLAEVVCNEMDMVALFKCQSVLLVLLPAVDGAAIGVYTRGLIQRRGRPLWQIAPCLRACRCRTDDWHC